MTRQGQEGRRSQAGPVLGRAGWTSVSAAWMASRRSLLGSGKSLRARQGSGPAGSKTQEGLGLRDVAKPQIRELDAV